MSRPGRSAPVAATVARIVGLAQLAVLLAAVPLAAVQAHRAWSTADGSPPSEDRQYTAIGYILLAVVAAGCAVLLGVALRRWGSGLDLGRNPLLAAEIVVLIASVASSNAIGGPHDRHTGYTALAALTAGAAVVVLVGANLPRARAWARRSVTGC